MLLHGPPVVTARKDDALMLVNGDQGPYGEPQEVASIALDDSVMLDWLPGRDYGKAFATITATVEVGTFY